MSSFTEMFMRNEAFRLVVILGGAGAFAISYEWYRRRRWRAAAESLGLSFSVGAAPSLSAPGPIIEHITGKYGRFSDLISGTFEGKPVAVSKHAWGSGKSERSQTLALFTTKRRLPKFLLSPEGIEAKLAAFFGGQDVDFPDDPDFSSKFRVRGDEGAIRAFFDPMLRRRLLDVDGWLVAGEGEELAVFKDHSTLSPRKLEAFVRDTRRVADLFG